MLLSRGRRWLFIGIGGRLRRRFVFAVGRGGEVLVVSVSIIYAKRVRARTHGYIAGKVLVCGFP